jgi:hypothetical protein
MRTQSPDTSPEAEKVMVDLLRRASSARKWQMVEDCNRAAKDAALARLRATYPTDSERQLRRRLASLWLGDELASKAFGR